MLYRDAFGFVVKDEDNFNIVCGEFVISINNNDNVSITQYKPSTNAPQAYTVTSVNELPTNAVDGSIAIAPTDSLIGKWAPLSENVTPINKSFDEGVEVVSISFIYDRDYLFDEDTVGEVYQFANQILFVGDNTLMEEIEVSNVSVDNPDISLNADIICVEGKWEKLWQIEFIENSDDIIFKDWVKANFVRVSGGYSLYNREDGEWIYTGEIV